MQPHQAVALRLFFCVYARWICTRFLETNSKIQPPRG
jgi:hypothetical protein